MRSECLGVPHLINLSVSAIFTVLFIIVSLAMTAADFELNPLTKRWTACSNSNVEVRKG